MKTVLVLLLVILSATSSLAATDDIKKGCKRDLTLNFQLIKDAGGIDAKFNDGHRQTLVFGDGLAVPFQLENGQVVIGTGNAVVVFSHRGNTLKMETWPQIYGQRNALGSWTISSNKKFLVATEKWPENLRLVKVDIAKLLSSEDKGESFKYGVLRLPLDKVAKIEPQDDGTVTVISEDGVTLKVKF